MREISNWSSIEAQSGEFTQLPAGGYVVQIIGVENVELNSTTGKGDYLRMSYDICEGEHKQHYSQRIERFGNGKLPVFVRSYKDSAAGMFKHFINCVEASNPGFHWSFAETLLIGKKVGVVLQEEEYQKQNGDIGTTLKVAQIKSVADIKQGNYKTPAKKVLSNTAPTNTTRTISDDDLPF